MSKIKTLTTKVLLAVTILAVGLTALPLSARAAGLADEGAPPQADNARLEQIWARELAAYNRAVAMLDKSSEFIGKVQNIIDRANEKGWDTSALQAALDAFEDAVRDTRPILNSASGIVNSHKGFDANGKVTDRAQAVETVKALGQHLKDARAAMGGTGQALREAIKAFRAAHPPATNTP
ncbi:MAG: hypothetical protein FD146_2138 [Anaerolineaceae bacterium]|nr:MAG: hypothetical protein FD146_2138 [Anaerolineaceae bacterium]